MPPNPTPPAVICSKSWSSPDKFSANYLVLNSSKDLIGQLGQLQKF